jgi:tetratricopeptide (TPR) repeat protein
MSVWIKCLSWIFVFGVGFGQTQVRADYGTDQAQYAATGRYDLIEIQVQDLLKKGPIRTRDQHALCFALSKLKRYDKLFSCLDSLEALIAKGDLRTRLFGLDDATPALHLMRAEASIDVSHFSAAYLNAQKALTWLAKDGGADQDLVVGAYAAFVIAAQLDGKHSSALKTLATLKSFAVNNDYRRAKAIALARAQAAVGQWQDVLSTLSANDAQFEFDKGLDQFLSGAAFAGRNNWLWVELPRSLLRHQAQLETTQYNDAKAGFDKLLKIPALAFNAEVYWQVLLGLGRVAEQAKRYAEALDYFRRARDAIESQRRTFRSELSKMGFSADRQAPYEGMIRIALATGNNPLAIEIAERAKARAIVESLSAKTNLADKANQSQELRRQFEKFDRADSALALQPPDPTERSNAELVQVREQSLNVIRKSSPELASLLTVDSLKIQDVVSRISKAEALLGFFSSGSDRYVYVCVDGKYFVKRLDLALSDSIISEFVQSVKKRRRSAQELSARLYDTIVKPGKTYSLFPMEICIMSRSPPCLMGNIIFCTIEVFATCQMRFCWERRATGFRRQKTMSSVFWCLAIRILVMPTWIYQLLKLKPSPSEIYFPI